MLTIISIVYVLIVCVMFRDYKKGGFVSEMASPDGEVQAKLPDLPARSTF